MKSPRYNIDTTAVLVEVSVSMWTARKLDKSVTDEVVHNKNAQSKGAARVNKSLLAGRPELDEIQKHVTAARTYVYEHTLPWSDAGIRLLPSKDFRKFAARVGMFNDEFTDKVEEFLRVYPTLITAQAMALGDMFKRDDYPTPEALRHKFSFRVNYMPVPSAGDFRVDVGNDAQDELRAQLQVLAQERVDAAMNDLRMRLKDHLTRMSDRLTTDVVEGEPKPRRFHASLVDTAHDLCDLVKSLNVVQDPDLEAARAALQDTIDGHTADGLRENDTARDDVKNKVDAILKKFTW